MSHDDACYHLLVGAVGGALFVVLRRPFVFLLVGAAWYVTAPFRWWRRRRRAD